MTGEWSDDSILVTPVATLPILTPSEDAVQPLSKLYIDKLHADTSQDDLVAILQPMTMGTIHRPFVSKLRNGFRWAKFDIEASVAHDFIDYFNLVAGVTHAQSHCEFARS